MREEILSDQRELVEQVVASGWEVTDTELSVYESPWVDGDDPEATITITARKTYVDDEEADSQFRVK